MKNVSGHRMRGESQYADLVYRVHYSVLFPIGEMASEQNDDYVPIFPRSEPVSAGTFSIKCT